MAAHSTEPFERSVSNIIQHLMVKNPIVQIDMKQLLCGLLTLDTKLPKELEEHAANILKTVVKQCVVSHGFHNGAISPPTFQYAKLTKLIENIATEKTERFLKGRKKLLEIMQDVGEDYKTKELAVQNLLKATAKNVSRRGNFEEVLVKGWVWGMDRELGGERPYYVAYKNIDHLTTESNDDENYGAADESPHESVSPVVGKDSYVCPTSPNKSKAVHTADKLSNDKLIAKHDENDLAKRIDETLLEEVKSMRSEAQNHYTKLSDDELTANHDENDLTKRIDEPILEEAKSMRSEAQNHYTKLLEAGNKTKRTGIQEHANEFSDVKDILTLSGIEIQKLKHTIGLIQANLIPLVKEGKILGKVDPNEYIKALNMKSELVVEENAKRMKVQDQLVENLTKHLRKQAENVKKLEMEKELAAEDAANRLQRTDQLVENLSNRVREQVQNVKHLETEKELAAADATNCLQGANQLVENLRTRLREENEYVQTLEVEKALADEESAKRLKAVNKQVHNLAKRSAEQNRYANALNGLLAGEHEAANDFETRLLEQDKLVNDLKALVAEQGALLKDAVLAID